MAELGKWRKRSQEAIREAVLALCDAHGLHPIALKSITPQEKRVVLKMVSDYYPFGQREHFPYKAWLKEVKIFREWVNGSENHEPLGGLFE